MEKLKGKTLLIGKEPVNGSLSLTISPLEGQTKAFSIGLPKSVPDSVSRCKPAEGIAHAKLDIDSNGVMKLTNLKDSNVTFVNGSEIKTKKVELSSRIELGMDKYSLNLNEVITAARKVAEKFGPKEVPIFDIAPLRKVWEKYDHRQIKRQKKQRRLGLYASAGMVFTLGGTALSFLAEKVGMGDVMKDIMPFLAATGGVVFLISFYLRAKDKSIEDAHDATEEFQETYTCPNPECNRFLGMQSFKMLKKQSRMVCPHCKCKFVDSSENQ